jgi:hypothetical protein
VNYRKPLLIALLAGAASGPLQAQQPAPPGSELVPAEEVPEEAFDGQEIVVTGERLRGAVIGDIEPEIQLDSRDIQAYGASSIAELVEALGPQIGSGRGREDGPPVMLVNGRRISGFSEIRDLPPEAIERVDILPEEVALKYGYRADQRVMNFVLRPRFRAITGEVETGMATAGGRGRYEADFNMLRIDDAGRWSVDFEYEHDAALFESQRDLIQADPDRPFDLYGNIAATAPGAEIDPALSALVGVPVTSIGVPASLGTSPTLGDFVEGANSVNRTDLGRYRTLVPETHQLEIAGTLNRTIFNDVSATFNARFEENGSQSYFGLPSATFILPEGNPYSPFASDVTLYRYLDGLRPLARQSETQATHFGTALNGDLSSRWRWSFTGNFDRSASRSATDRDPDVDAYQALLDAGSAAFNPFAPLPGASLRDRTRSVDQSANGELVLNGPLVELPAGDVTTSVRFGGETRDFFGETQRSGVVQVRELGRDRANAQANVDVPIASRSDDVLSFLGDVSVNGNAEVERLSDFGTLVTYGGGLNWEPIEDVRLIASFTQEEGAPSVQQLGNPVSITPNVRVFDFTRGETVEVTAISGGNPDLISDSRRVMKLGLNIKPWEEKELTIRADYTNSRTRNLISSFPTITNAIEKAFPERFERHPTGRLFRIDTRPVNFARADRSEIRWGIHYSKPIESSARGGVGGWRQRAAQAENTGTAPPAAGAAPRQGGAAPGAAPAQRGGAAAPTAAAGASEAAPPRAGGGFGRGGFGRGGFGRGGQGQGGRLMLGLFHTWHLENEILIREGVPVLDLLDGSATGGRGGQPRHQVELQAGLFKDGFGANLNLNWQSATFVRGGLNGSGGQASDLYFSDFGTANLWTFADLGQQQSLVRKHPWLRGTRVSVGITNLFDSRLRVTNDAGETPLTYQPDYLDPIGRAFRVQVRKLFF